MPSRLSVRRTLRLCLYSLNMRLKALAFDFDGTSAKSGHVESSTLERLAQWRSSGRRLILITGGTVEELINKFPFLGLLDLLIAEDGGLLMDCQEENPEPQPL